MFDAGVVGIHGIQVGIPTIFWRSERKKYRYSKTYFITALLTVHTIAEERVEPSRQGMNRNHPPPDFDKNRWLNNFENVNNKITNMTNNLNELNRLKENLKQVNKGKLIIIIIKKCW
jgi:hypothetical protein